MNEISTWYPRSLWIGEEGVRRAVEGLWIKRGFLEKMDLSWALEMSRTSIRGTVRGQARRQCEAVLHVEGTTRAKAWRCDLVSSVWG